MVMDCSDLICGEEGVRLLRIDQGKWQVVWLRVKHLELVQLDSSCLPGPPRDRSQSEPRVATHIATSRAAAKIAPRAHGRPSEVSVRR